MPASVDELTLFPLHFLMLLLCPRKKWLKLSPAPPTQISVMVPLLIFQLFSVAVFWRGKAYTSWSQFTIEGSQGRNLSRSRGRKHAKRPLTGLLCWPAQLAFLHSCLGMALPTVGWTILHQLAIKKMPYRNARKPIWSTPVVETQITLEWVKSNRRLIFPLPLDFPENYCHLCGFPKLSPFFGVRFIFFLSLILLDISHKSRS